MTGFLLAVSLLCSAVAMISLLWIAVHVARIDRVLTVWAQTWADPAVREQLLAALKD